MRLMIVMKVTMIKSTYECGPKLILCDYCKKEYLLPAYE